MDRLTAMEVFVRVIETGSFSGAATQLHLGQPAVSKIIAQLEDRLGVRLLLRSSRGLTPTEAGQNFHARAKRAIEEAKEAEHAARGAGAGLSGRLRFSCNLTLARLHIIPHLAQFLDAHPDLGVDAILEDRVVDMVEEGIDVSLMLGEIRTSTITAHKIGEWRRLVLGTPAYFEQAGQPVVPADLAHHRAVIYVHPVGGMIWSFRRVASEETVTLNGTVHMSVAEGLREAVFAGLGLCVAPQWMFEPELASGRVTQVMSDWSLPAMDVWLAFPSGRRRDPKVRAFGAFVEDQLRGPA